MANKLVVSSSPHLRTPESVDSIMRDVLIALIPPLIVSAWLFSLYSIWMVVVATVVCMVSEAVMVHKSVSLSKIKGDWSAAVTGVIYGLSLPPGTPWWVVAIGAFIAISVGKHVFGGLGYNIFNPALVGRAFVVLAWPSYLTHWTEPFQAVDFDSATAATPLVVDSDAVSLSDLFVGTTGGSIGETSILAILLGAVFLLVKGHIDIRIPAAYMGAVAVMALVTGQDIMYHLFSGSAFFAAVYMATCMVTSPYTKTGKLIFGFGCGLFTALFRMFGSAPEGVTYAILLMNALVPFINKYTRPKIYGEVSN
ncbi:RnfABCDGE type electron transport complex subunit D [Natranaerobius thermophilus]|uniref:Ion-translocating oxidoreductase complex subunit D n=1 Tax=Natranaerobius thermophilus (strain ATCC BAA-1301 / DSM 18059 / JW/NM-WN-LF) TaxID=457570 RepID=B2A680_NATTJ|nr:RnfABCDGE type electron transport complex subunit D [Natranaerobius thermophilus]ACB84091.1 electron transport complex, RnfABCDGE type, D subunit [Natranaerobius thermophilus JW/NM-WN-LF]